MEPDGAASYHHLFLVMATPSNIHPLPNSSYQHPQHANTGPHKRDHWFFSRRGVWGVNLSDACSGRLEDLDWQDDVLRPARFVKVTRVITIRGHRIFRRVKNMQCVRGGVPMPVPRHKVARCITDAMFAFLNQDHDLIFALGPGVIEMQHLYSLEVRRYNNTLVPVFSYRPPSTGPAVPEINAQINDPFVATLDNYDGSF
ncbi:uncharacterized protein PHACADRAFT_197128 [Phanerochaete carnosa HHB-10118-sp]|uniref:Uncharacterized protein n=1 Tax=Phanerochaete carnosa (strain HHB-10118-sp) TaxID=650164 RepID=K5UX77_PHACS|nr:uncharacterized protein PHACADRAFT_197128 [Phanerochaete carnosa HHB-10118-sp]EKM54696.1 hypothetical protein PHACADRAFT_197128 [Phanerochaete carnosa HHB-10118-sp]